MVIDPLDASDLTTDQRVALDASGQATSPAELKAALAAMTMLEVPAIWQALSVEAYRRRALETWVMMIEGSSSRQPSPWRDLATDPPSGERSVLLFPQDTRSGHLFIVSNTDYARKNGIKHGYTHWMDIPLVPGGLEDMAIARNHARQA